MLMPRFGRWEIGLSRYESRVSNWEVKVNYLEKVPSVRSFALVEAMRQEGALVTTCARLNLTVRRFP